MKSFPVSTVLVMPIFLVVYSSFVSSCNTNEDVPNAVIETSDNGVVKTERFMGAHDSTYYLIEYYPTGDTMMVSETDSTNQRNGKTVVLKENGDTSAILNLRNDKLHGYQEWYKNGHIAAKGWYNMDIPDGEMMTYGDNGLLSNYLYHETDGSIVYHAFFDENGFRIDTGSAIFQYAVSYKDKFLSNGDSVALNDSAIVYVSTARPDLQNFSSTLLYMAFSEGEMIEQEVISQEGNYLNINFPITFSRLGDSEVQVLLTRTKEDDSTKMNFLSKLRLEVVN